VCDLDMPVRIEVCPTVRESDGLALSSRNAHLSPAERARATALHRALAAMQRAVDAGERDPETARARAFAELESAQIEPDYVELVSPDTLAPVPTIDGDVLALIAARVGSTRLIDNELIRIPTQHRGVATRLGASTTA
jgi:pantoate--beta-alanine ligase